MYWKEIPEEIIANFMDSTDFYIDCSDEEKYDMRKINNEWMPPPEDIIKLYEAINEKDYLGIEWQCPGRRPPTPVNDITTMNSLIEDISDKELDRSDFDFQEEMSHLKLRPTISQPKGSAKKKTTSLNAILSNMARHRKLDMINTKPNK